MSVAAAPPNPAVIAPVPGVDLRLYADRWWEVKEEQARALREQQERKAAERQAKAGESRHWSVPVGKGEQTYVYPGGDERAGSVRSPSASWMCGPVVLELTPGPFECASLTRYDALS